MPPPQHHHPSPPLHTGHSATAGAAAAVIAKHLGANKPFTIGTEFPGLAPRSYAGIQEVRPVLR